ncbi:hypothetical protein T06_912 [Trichinella sp. T6]|nr:hypothetical protein T06_912 [Trichinella sp. T6]
MSDSKEAVIKAGDAAVVTEGGYLPPCCVGMKHYEIVATYFDLFKVIVHITAPLEKPTKPLQYFFENSVMPMWEDYENIDSCRCQVVMKKKHDDLNVLKDKLMQMTKGNCRFYCKLNPTFFKKTEALEE